MRISAKDIIKKISEEDVLVEFTVIEKYILPLIKDLEIEKELVEKNAKEKHSDQEANVVIAYKRCIDDIKRVLDNIKHNR